MSYRRLLLALALVGLFGWLASPRIMLLFAKPGICVETDERMDDAAFIKAAIEEWALGPRTYSGFGIQGSKVVALWPSAEAYLAEFPQCCELYDGPAGDWFTPPERIPALWGQKGRVVRLTAPIVDFVEGEPKIGFAQRFSVLDDCAREADFD